MKKILLLILLLYCGMLYAQDSIVHRVILIGDAGEMGKWQSTVLAHAAGNATRGKTTVLYLGDNIYPRGMALPGAKNEKETQDILRSQYQPMRSKGLPVYFLPGNHDWDKMGPKGLAKIKQQWEFLEAQQDSLLKLVPPNGCPDPVEINVSDSLTIIAFDSEWWLYIYNKRNPDADCDCSTREDIVAAMEDILYRNRYKTIILADHHPFKSYGTHGGYFSWKDHIFPLTAANKNLYIPLPGIGTLYPLLRSLFTSPEDLKHPLYREMIKKIDGVFEGFPNLIVASGHEHGLQLIKDKNTQVISGAGSKNTYARKGKYSLFADAVQGYVTADLMLDNSVRLTYYVYTDTGMRSAYVYNQPHVSVKFQEDAAIAAIATDSVDVQVRPDYDKVSKFHRTLFGEGFRKEWAATTRLPVIRVSEFGGGLKPLRLGGGMQSKSLRLEDANGKEWVIRSVEKNPDALLPPELRQTFARDLLDDATSGQHPYSALIIPPIADAVNVPHANPVIGVIAPDKSLGVYTKTFTNMVCLVEEREPLGKSDNSEKLFKNLVKDNDNGFKGKEFLRARLLDMLVNDWDRHPDQWRWYDTNKDKEKNKDKDKKYVAVPRDRDQVLHLTQGWLPRLASRSWILPTLQGFSGEIPRVRYSIIKSNFLNPYPDFQFNYDEWMKVTNEFVSLVTDSVLEESLRRLPASSYNLRHDLLFQQLKERRGNMPAAMDKFYHFIYQKADIRLSDKNELVEIIDGDSSSLRVIVKKINKDGEIKDVLISRTFTPDITSEVRLYLSAGNDSVVINNQSKVKLRLIGGSGNKVYNVIHSDKRIQLYDKKDGTVYMGDAGVFKKHLSADTGMVSFVPTNLYSVTMPLATIGINADDGFLMGLGFKHTQQGGFRKTPYANTQQLIAGHSFSTKAYRFVYRGEWIHVFGKADLVARAIIKAPNNTVNFFGRGNETEYVKEGDFKKYYRTRYSSYEAGAGLRWRSSRGSSVTIGPAFQYYRFDADDNKGRFINNVSQIGSYDSATIDKNKIHLGAVIDYILDKRNNTILPSWGYYINLRLQGYAGLNEYAKSYGQFIPEISFYKSLNAKQSVVLANRTGGGVTVGKSAFYQSLFLGGQENLLGYRQYRFAGQHSMYNNLEMRVRLATIASYIVPGQLGLTGFYDIGRVWEQGESSGKWHNGVGGGLYFAPAQVAVFKFVMGYSEEGWYPYFTMGMRF
ncbi:MAG: BamA/TamA family outer membrane protein [Chitinophagaceae bacterium]